MRREVFGAGLQPFAVYFSAMSQTTTTVPLSADEAGVLRVAGTRVPLDSVVYAFN